MVSASRTSRNRRHGRSHAGGSSYLPQNEFPIFSHTGDVEILIKAGGKENRYLLHRLILTQCSGFFEASTSQEWSKAMDGAGGELARIGEESSGAGKPAKKRWIYELDAGASGDDVPILVQKDLSSSQTGSLFGPSASIPPQVRNKPTSSQAGFFRSVANLSISSATQPQLSVEDEDILRDYDNMFRVFYNYAPAIDSINIAEAYVHCKSLLSVADQYDCLDVVGPRIDHHLLQFNSRLWKQVAKYPPSYLKLGYLARSKIIFSEALIHVVGQWPLGERHLRASLPERVLEIIEDKVDELADTVARIEGRLFRLTLHTPRGERVSPAGSYIDFLAVSFYRNWLADMTSPPSAPAAKAQSSRQGRDNNGRSQPAPPPPYTPGPTSAHFGRTFRLIGSSNQTAYLGHEECKKFLKLTPEHYSRDGLKKFEKRMTELKEMAREVVRPLMRCELQLESSEAVGYLTCTRVLEQDYVWE